MRDGMKLTQWRRRSFLRPATIWRTSVVGSEDVAKDTKAFHFKKPDGFRFDAGQSIYVALPHLTPTDTKGRVRTFSIASAPQDAELVIATRLTEAAFKRNLESLPLGSSVEIEGPYGDLTLHNDTDRPAVFLAGGIGITPFRSIIRDATERSLPYNLYFFYSNRRPEDAAFLSEMRELERRSSRFKLVATVTDAGTDAGWSGERGYLTPEMIAKHVADITKPIYYLAGPPAMISAMETVLRNAGVRRENVRAEAFSGY
jgi:ferredoxin-NADP reductase